MTATLTPSTIAVQPGEVAVRVDDIAGPRESLG